MDLRLVLCESKEQKDKFKEIVEKHHSYVAHVRHIGRRLDYLVMLGEQCVGAVGLGSIPMPISKGILTYFEPLLGRTNGKVMLKPIFNSIADNWRFCLTPEAPKNSGSRVLSRLLKLAPKDWKARYGDELKWVITYVEEAHKGTIYRAAGWDYRGKTGGLVPSRDYTQGNRADGKVRYEKMGKGTGMGAIVRKPHNLTGKGMTDWQGQPHVPEKRVVKKHIFIKDLREKGEGEAVVVQSSTPGFQSGDGVRSDPAAPLTKSYKLEVRGGKVRMVKT